MDASPAAFHGELQPVASCDELLEHYQDEALRIVGPYGWELGYGHFGRATAYISTGWMCERKRP